VVTLDRNYRSTSTILQAANAVIARNLLRREKNLWSKKDGGDPIEVVTAKDEIDEADFVAARIQALRKELHLSWKDFGVLYRSNLQSRPFEMRFRQAKTPYVVTGGTEFFDRKEVKDIAAYLRVVANPRDEVALRRIVNVPARGIGDTSLLRLDEAAKARGIPLFEVLKGHANGNLPDSATNGIREFLSLLKETSQTLRAEGLGKGVQRLILRSGYLEEVEKTSPSPNVAEIRKQIVLEVANAASAHERANENATLLNFLQEVSLAGDYQQNRNEQRYQGDAVRLATLHSAKGLEFPVVFLVGVEEGLLPHSRSMLFDNEVLEERRVMYVGMTRAMRRLILTTASLRTVRGRPKQTLDSRFLSEIPDNLVRFRMSDEPFLSEPLSAEPPIRSAPQALPPPP
jgi:DNA helicase-2/ATP-dependent DNA helicase PcrA